MTDDSLAFEDKLELQSWGLPDYILEKYLKRGVSKMFPWQVECLMSENVLLGGNLIYSAPTSAGKTLVSEILALKTVLERKKKVIVILPFVSVVREKMIYFQDVLCGSGIRVEGFMGSYNPPGGFKNVHLAICTIEKANNLINRMLENKDFDDIGCIVVDELHLLGDPNRGYLLELLLTKLKYVCQKGIAQNIQIVGMSATLPNLDLLARWLNATLYHTEFRPIPLYEYLKVGQTIYKGPELVDSFELKTICEIPNDPGDVVSICLDTIIQGFSVLVFCPAKNWCETLAVQISSEIKRLGNGEDDTAQSLRSQLNSRGIYDTLEQLKKCPAGLERNLGKSVSFGVAYHHAGLTLDERDIIEGGFRRNIIRVLVATSTLSSGVNLPARRVIVRSPAFQGQCMDILTYKQMIGRAGRMGKDTAGESYLVCTEKDLNWGKQLVTSQLPPVESCLGYGDLSSSLKRALLEVIAGGVVTSHEEVMDYVQCTLLAVSVNNEKISKAVESCTNYLKEKEFIKVDSDGGVIPSSLAEACLSSSVPPDQALYLLKELHKARQCFVLDSDLHAIYQVTPYSICDSWQVDWMNVFAIWENLPENLQKIGELVGVEDRFLIRAMRGTINLNADEHAHKVSIHKRFYTCLALQDLINEMPLNEVVAKYGCNKGMLQSLQQSASTFAAMVTNFCRKLGWGGMEVLLSELATRIQFGVQKELLDLLRLDCMTSVMARSLFNCEITTLSELAGSGLQAVQLAVNKAKPFKSEIIEAGSPGNNNIHLPGRPGLTDKEAADILIFEARRHLLKEMGVKTAEWEDSKIDLRANDSIYERTTLVADNPENNGENNSASTSTLVNPTKEDKSYMEGKSKDNKIENQEIINNKMPGKSTTIDSKTKISERNELDESDDGLPDTLLINTEYCDVDVTKIKRTDDPEELAKVFHPESQGKEVAVFSSPESTKSENFLEKGLKKLKNGDLEPYRPTFSELQNEKSPENEKRLFTSTRVSTSPDPINFSVFKNNAKLCSTYIGADEKKSIDMLSLEALCGSPEKTDINFIDTILGRLLDGKIVNPSCQGPVFSTPDPKSSNKESTNNSANDLFLESPTSASPNKSKTYKNQNLEELDPNWGGDSLLELSQNFEKNIELHYQVHPTQTLSSKRKARDVTEENMPLYKKVCLNNTKMKELMDDPKSPFPNEKSDAQKANSSKNDEKNDAFGDSFDFDTQIEDQLKTDTTPKRSSPPKKFLIPKPTSSSVQKIQKKLFPRPKSDGDLGSTNCNPTMTDTFLAKAFDGTFKFIENPETEDLRISDSEDVIDGSPEALHSSKYNFSGCSTSRVNKTITKSLRLLNSPIKIISPKGSPSHSSPPVKYPPIGSDILKLYKSPSQKRALTFSSKSPGCSPKRSIKISSPSVKSSIVLESKTPESSPVKKDKFFLEKPNIDLSKISSNNNATLIQREIKLQDIILAEKTPECSPDDKNPSLVETEIILPTNTENFLDRINRSTDLSHEKPGLISSQDVDSKNNKEVISLTINGTKLSSITQSNSGKGCNKISDLLLPLADKLLSPKQAVLPINLKPDDTLKDTKDKLPRSKSMITDNFYKNSRMIDVIAAGENNIHVEALQKLKEFAFAIKTKKVNDKETQKSKIGGRIVRNIVKNEEPIEPQFKVDDEAIIGVYLYGGSVTYFFNMITLDALHYRILKGLFSQRAIKLYGLNLISQFKLFYKCCGYIISCRIFDVAIADWLLNPEENYKSIEELASEYLKPSQRSPVKSENDVLTEVSLIWSLRSELTKRLQKANLIKHFEEIEMPIQSQVLFMELTGFGFNHDFANELWTASTELMGKLEMDAYSFANRKFPLNSNSELSKVKNELKIPAEVEADHPLVITVQNWRKLHSLKTRNLGQLLFKKESRCHSSSSTRTVTGRIIVHDPDLQHIPRDFTVDEQLFSLRSAFEAGVGNILVSADYSQLELRILAHFSQDPMLVPLLRKGDDVFKNIAAEWNGISTDKVTDELRHQVKQLTYGIIYGMGDKALGEALGKTAADASMLSARFKRSFPKLEDFVKRTIEECRCSGEVKTLAGRVRRLPGINSNNIHARAQAERQAVNSKIQGSASDIAKKAMIEVENKLNRVFPGRGNLPSTLHTSHLVLQLHDEFIYEVEENVLSKFVPILRDTMETSTFLSVPLPVVVKTGKNWGVMKSL